MSNQVKVKISSEPFRKALDELESNISKTPPEIQDLFFMNVDIDKLCDLDQCSAEGEGYNMDYTLIPKPWLLELLAAIRIGDYTEFKETYCK